MNISQRMGFPVQGGCLRWRTRSIQQSCLACQKPRIMGCDAVKTDESVLGSLLCFAPAAPWVWRAMKLKRRLFRA